LCAEKERNVSIPMVLTLSIKEYVASCGEKEKREEGKKATGNDVVGRAKHTNC
jgi:hypothetical protein